MNMKGTPMADEDRTQELRCQICGAAIECCEFCDEEDCAKAVCYACVIVVLGEALPQPHVHGG